MMKFKGEIWKTGNSYVLTVPAQYVKDGVLSVGVLYEVDVN